MWNQLAYLRSDNPIDGRIGLAAAVGIEGAHEVLADIEADCGRGQLGATGLIDELFVALIYAELVGDVFDRRLANGTPPFAKNVADSPNWDPTLVGDASVGHGVRG